MSQNKRKPLVDNNSVAVPSKRNKLSIKSLSQYDKPQRRAGTIQRLVLTNFMCHSLLDVQLGSNVTVITGRNGSGKSALLTALIVGLGGRVSLTNRAQNIRSLIKSGKNQATIEIILNNEGPMAYKPIIYGSTITVLRSIYQSGSSSYKIKSSDGNVVSTQARELHSITTVLNIQIDNPVCILNQDTSRSFLNTSDTKKKFELFIKATKLDTLKEQYEKIYAMRNVAIRELEKKEMGFRESQQELKKLQNQMNVCERLKEYRHRIPKLEGELLWARVQEIEVSLNNLQKNVEFAEKKIQALTANHITSFENIETKKTIISDLQREMDELRESVNIQTQPQVEIKRKIDDLQKKYNDQDQRQNVMQQKINMKQSDVVHFRKDLCDIQKRAALFEKQKRDQIIQQEKFENQLKDLESRLETCRNDLYQQKNDMERQTSERQTKRQEIFNIDRELEAEQRRLNSLQNDSDKGNFLLYGHEMPRIKELIVQNRRRFSEQPRGPLGSYIKLKDKKWVVAAENYIGPNLLRAFVVNNASDNKILDEIFIQACGRHGRTPMTITTKFLQNKHDVQNHLVQSPSDCISLHSVLDIDDPVVYNCIIDQSSLENVLLLPSDDRAIELFEYESNVPRNCHQGLTAKGDVYYPSPNYRTYGSRNFTAKYLQVDMKEHIRQLEETISILKRRKEPLLIESKTLNAQCTNSENRKNCLEDTIRQLTTQRSELRNNLDECKWSAQTEIAKPEMMEEELKHLENTINEMTCELNNLNREKKSVHQELQMNLRKLEELRQSTKDLDKRSETIENNLREHTINLKELRVGEEMERKQLEVFSTQMQIVKDETNTKKHELMEQQQEAKSKCARMSKIRKASEIQADLSSTEKRIRQGEADTEPIEAVTAKFNELNPRLESASELITTLNENIDELKLAIEQRNAICNLMETRYILSIKSAFTNILNQRQFNGAIDINVPNKTLDIQVIPQQGTQGLVTTSNLSGGERSFSTVAFLYSLWQCMDFPFYILDEFDVYMDKQNRSKVLDILISHAQRHPGLQFVFLTPQDVSSVVASNSVFILRLQDPQRGQTTDE